MFIFLSCLIELVIIFFCAGFVRSWYIQNNDQEKVFLAGRTPNPLPDGPYHGTVPGYRVSWLGKKFNAADHSGVNLFETSGHSTGDTGTSGNAQKIPTEKYRFKTSIGAGLKDTAITVVKIDYDIPENPFWLRWILDEIVETAPGVYLGKMIVRIFGLSFALVYFTLQK
jgi:hypothetical protein